jgi:hypothetical protein
MSEKLTGCPRQRVQVRLRRSRQDGDDGVTESPLSAIFYLSDEKRPSAALPLLHVNDVPGGTPYSVKLRAPSIWVFLISPDTLVDQ